MKHRRKKPDEIKQERKCKGKHNRRQANKYQNVVVWTHLGMNEERTAKKVLGIKAK
jgi:hypothetical protein